MLAPLFLEPLMMSRAAYVETAAGTVHTLSAGDGFPVLLLHQTPRSVDEYRDVVPLVGQRFRAIAMDTPGFGATSAPPAASIESWAHTALALFDALHIKEAAVVGHHTGAAIAMEVAAAAPQRVAALVLSACPFVDAERRSRHAETRVIDEVHITADGAHAAEMWRRRQPFYPAGDTDLLTRYLADALRCGPMAVEGHRCVNRYRMEERIGLVRAPTLVLAPTADPHAYPAARKVAASIAGATYREIEGAMVPFPDQMPAVFAREVCGFVAAHASGGSSETEKQR